MNPLTLATGKIALLVFLAVPLHAADQVTRLFSQAGSRVTVKGGNNLHSWDVQSRTQIGWIEFGAGFPSSSGQIVNLGKVHARIEGHIPVRSLHISEGKTVDEAMYHRLKEETNPHIFFCFSELSLKALPKSNNDAYLFDSRGELVVAGITNQVSMPFSLIPLGDHKLKITGSTSVKMTDFDIQPPEIRVDTNGVVIIRYRDQIELNVEWLVGPKLND